MKLLVCVKNLQLKFNFTKIKYFVLGLLNLRGKDQINTPIFYSFLIVTQKDVILFVTKSRITTKILTHFEEEGIDVLIKSFDKNLLLIEIETIVL